MIAAALDFLSGESLREEPETMAFASVLQSLCDDYAGLGGRSPTSRRRRSPSRPCARCSAARTRR